MDFKLPLLIIALAMVLFSAPLAWGVPRDSLVMLEKVQSSIQERQQALQLNQKLLQENARLLQQNLDILYKIRSLKNEDAYEGATLSESIRSTLQAQRQNQQEFLETQQAIDLQRQLYAKNARVMQDLQTGHYSLELKETDDSAAILENLNLSIRKNRSIAQKNQERLEENRASVQQNKQILSALAD